MKESDLYPPLKLFLESQKYEVKGEVQDCDVVAVRGKEPPVVVELKLTLNLDVVLQAVDRQALTPNVYIGVPNQSKNLIKRRKRIVKLLRMLGLGLIVIDPEREIGRVRHAINNPLMGLLGHAELLKDSPDLAPRLRTRVETIMAESRRISEQVKLLAKIDRPDRST